MNCQLKVVNKKGKYFELAVCFHLTVQFHFFWPSTLDMTHVTWVSFAKIPSFVKNSLLVKHLRDFFLVLFHQSHNIKQKSTNEACYRQDQKRNVQFQKIFWFLSLFYHEVSLNMPIWIGNVPLDFKKISNHSINGFARVEIQRSIRMHNNTVKFSPRTRAGFGNIEKLMRIVRILLDNSWAWKCE